MSVYTAVRLVTPEFERASIVRKSVAWEVIDGLLRVEFRDQDEQLVEWVVPERDVIVYEMFSVELSDEELAQAQAVGARRRSGHVLRSM